MCYRLYLQNLVLSTSSLLCCLLATFMVHKHLWCLNLSCLFSLLYLLWITFSCQADFKCYSQPSFVELIKIWQPFFVRFHFSTHFCCLFLSSYIYSKVLLIRIQCIFSFWRSIVQLLFFLRFLWSLSSTHAFGFVMFCHVLHLFLPSFL